MWVWDQSAGTLSKDGAIVSRGYSGKDEGGIIPRFSLWLASAHFLAAATALVSRAHRREPGRLRWTCTQWTPRRVTRFTIRLADLHFKFTATAYQRREQLHLAASSCSALFANRFGVAKITLLRW